MPFSGTRNPICIVRAPKNFDAEVLRLYLSKYIQDNDMRNILYDVYEKRNPKQLILLRGASGSGKSTLALVLWSISDTGEICSADHYFINRHGQYNFKREQLGEAHASCRTKCQNGMQRGDSPIIIDNTNTRVDEMMPYVQLAVEHNYDIQIVEPKTEWRRKAHLLAQKTVHGVPKRSIQDQLDRFENTSVKIMVDRVLKQQRPSASAYNPVRNLEWGATGLDGTGDWVGATAALTTASSPVFTTTTSKPMANNNIKPLMTPAIKPNLSNPITPPPLFSFPAFQPRTATQASVNSPHSFNPVVTKSNVHFPVVSSSKPAANNPQISWTETPTTTPTSPG
ncbi:NEDD4-binding protein 2-like 1 [Orchesella cincta]|uniref:NEDD4-binding protein 2-like 1 n=1 Tax=Orchesella cincta TaxID=48709 RepID=A0A1D2NMI8_ORCCI|nr:NEDD4-binding protein 2-like 1 [Orchesella cincta]